MELSGTVHHLGDEINVSASYTKRELVIKTEEQYPQLILIEFGQGKCNEYLDKLTVNEPVKVSINIGGREWVNPQGETKYFNSIKGWKIEKLSSTSTGTTPAPAPATSPTASAPQSATSQASDEEDDLPF